MALKSLKNFYDHRPRAKTAVSPVMTRPATSGSNADCSGGDVALGEAMTEDSELALHGHVDLRFFFLFASRKGDDEQKARHARKRVSHSRPPYCQGSGARTRYPTNYNALFAKGGRLLLRQQFLWLMDNLFPSKNSNSIFGLALPGSSVSDKARRRLNHPSDQERQFCLSNFAVRHEIDSGQVTIVARDTERGRVYGRYGSVFSIFGRKDKPRA